MAMSSALYVRMVEWMLEELQMKNEESKENRQRWTERERQREYHKATNIFSFCVHLADIGDINDWQVSVDQSCRKLQHSHDGTILK